MSDQIQFVGRVEQKFENLLKFSFNVVQLPQPNEKGYINLDICKKKDGSGWYAKVNTWKPKQAQAVTSQDDSDQAGMPF